MLKGLCAAAAALPVMSCLALADAGEPHADHQYPSGVVDDPWTAPDSSFPKKREWPDGPNKQFLQNLQRPDNHKHPYRDKHSQSCCDAGDTVKTKFKVEPAQGSAHPEDRCTPGSRMNGSRCRRTGSFPITRPTAKPTCSC
jgi:hypothetical protein